jgi:hypothetical protein
MVSEPAVDTNPAQHHMSSFPSQFVGMGFVGRRRRGAYDLGGSFAGSGDLEPPSSQQIFKEGFGGLILARRGRRPDGKRRTGNLKALRLGGGIDHDGRALGQKIEAVEGIVPVRLSLVARCAAIGLMQLRIADLPIFVLGCCDEVLLEL